MRKSQKSSQKSVFILGVRVDSTSKDKVPAWVLKQLSKNQKSSLFTPNPEMLVLARSDSEFKAILNNSDLNIADGVGLGLPVVRGREVFESILSLNLPNRKLKIFLLGSTKQIINKSLARLKNYNNLEVAGFFGPKLKNNGETDSVIDISLQKDAVDRINKFKPDILFVAFGAPKQEKWIAKWLPNLNVKIAMGIGGTLDYFSKSKSLPPPWLANLGFEWLWRLIHEKGHARRVVRALIEFPLYLALDHILGNPSKKLK